MEIIKDNISIHHIPISPLNKFDNNANQTAPMIIVPSIPMFTIPDLSDNSPAIDAIEYIENKNKNADNISKKCCNAMIIYPFLSFRLLCYLYLTIL